MNQLRKFLIIALLMVQTACITGYYPNKANMKLFSQKKDASICLSTAKSNDLKKRLNTIELQAAYAVTNHFAVFLNTQYVGDALTTYNNPKKFYGHLFGEVGAGLFSKIKSRWRFGIYGGIGSGYSQLPTGSNVPIKIGFYPEIGYVNKYVQFGFQLRNIFNTPTNIKSEPNSNVFMTDELTGYVFEPAYTIRAGYQMVFVEFQWGISLCKFSAYSRYRSSFFYNWGFNGIMSVGLYLNLSKLKDN